MDYLITIPATRPTLGKPWDCDYAWRKAGLDEILPEVEHRLLTLDWSKSPLVIFGYQVSNLLDENTEVFVRLKYDVQRAPC